MTCTVPAKVRSVVALLVCFALTGCVPTPMPKRARGAAGTDLPGVPDTSQIHLGFTTRAEILEKFSSINTGVPGQRLFVGRWAFSHGGGNGIRDWTLQDLIVRFNDQGIVEKYAVSSDADLLNLLPTYLDSKEVEADLAHPSSHTYSDFNGSFAAQVIVDKNRLHFVWGDIAPDEVIGLGEFQLAHMSADPAKYNLVVRLRKRLGDVRHDLRDMKSLDLKTDVPTVVLLVEFVQQSH